MAFPSRKGQPRDLNLWAALPRLVVTGGLGVLSSLRVLLKLGVSFEGPLWCFKAQSSPRLTASG